jgi:SAM-dependent methyltransferase
MNDLPSEASACPACGNKNDSAAKRRRCAHCGTIWMPDRFGYVYDDSYPEQRSHHDAIVSRCKQITLSNWVRRLGADLQGKRVLEVGFGGGATLEWLQGQGALTFGQEPVAANRAAAERIGIPSERIAGDLAKFEGVNFDLALYLDAFEHLSDPVAHLSLLDRITAPGSKAMLVLPVADSFSRVMLGSLWPHDIQDHWIFYSSRGLQELWGRFGWRIFERFYPLKYVSALTVSRHIQSKFGKGLSLGPLAKMGFWLNFGERGFVFERSRAR